jgi:CheY-like chemotaxis protein
MANECILLVDDDPETLASLGRVLSNAGYTTKLAADAVTGMTETQSSRPAVVISDVLMTPGINGYQFCRQLKAAPQTRGIPVILMSGKTDPADQFWAKEVGARVLLRKPVENTRLLSEIANLLKG